jgi:hypothetical protein
MTVEASWANEVERRYARVNRAVSVLAATACSARNA